jgi:hypothetical protein
MPTRGSLCSPRAILQRPYRGAKAIFPQDLTRRIAHFIAIPALKGWAKISPPLGDWLSIIDNTKKQMALGEDARAPRAKKIRKRAFVITELNHTLFRFLLCALWPQ